MMTRIILVLLIAISTCACKTASIVTAESNVRQAEALERIANVLENPNCICPQATRSAPVEDADGGVE